MTHDEVPECIKRLVDSAPPFTPDQLIKLAVLLRPDLPVGIAPKKPTAKPERAGPGQAPEAA